jgi:hypothetical protein
VAVPRLDVEEGACARPGSEPAEAITNATAAPAASSAREPRSGAARGLAESSPAAAGTPSSAASSIAASASPSASVSSIAAAVSRSSPVREAGTGADEDTLLRMAKQAIVTDPGRAVALLREHERRFKGRNVEVRSWLREQAHGAERAAAARSGTQ